MSDSLEQFDKLRDELRDRSLRTTNLVYRIDRKQRCSVVFDAAEAASDLANRLLALHDALELGEAAMREMREKDE